MQSGTLQYNVEKCIGFINTRAVVLLVVLHCAAFIIAGILFLREAAIDAQEQRAFHAAFGGFGDSFRSDAS
jgi:hypothetical protein